MDNLGFGGGSPYAVNNPYLDKSVADAQAQTTRSFNNTTQPAFTSSMVRSGSFGNSGLEQAQSDATRQYQDTLGKQANDMYSGQYQFGQQLGQQQNQYNRSLDQAQNQFGRNLDQNNSQFGRNLDQNQNQFGRNLDQNMNQFNLNFDRGTYNDAFNHNQQNYQNGLNLIGMQNTSNQQNLGFGTQIQNAPQNYYQGFSNSATGIGKGFGTSSQTSTAVGSPLMGALGGAQIGKQIQGTFGSSPYQRDTSFGENGSGNYFPE